MIVLFWYYNRDRKTYIAASEPCGHGYIIYPSLGMKFKLSPQLISMISKHNKNSATEAVSHLRLPLTVGMGPETHIFIKGYRNRGRS